MSGRYAPLPNEDVRNEMDAAFDDSDDEGDDYAESESQPLNPRPTSRPTHSSRPSIANAPAVYDFENVDYDYPPPGSPPGPSSRALPNEYGNSNGLVPTFNVDSSRGPRLGWFSRAATAVLPTHYAQRLGIGRHSEVIGNNNDGVFANVTAKPTPPIRIQDGDSTYVVPEETRAEAPPSYASAQADSVPQYYEVHAPFAPGTVGEVLIDSLPSGTLFSFLWNMLVSVSFQFVGFLLTYLLHTTHAARLGARAGLGVTLIQYGFALRSRGDSEDDNNSTGMWASWTNPRPNYESAADAAAYYNGTGDATPTTLTPEQANAIVADATSEWLSFFLMTIGWFILLTSVLGFWRVKRWERGVLSAQRENPGAIPPPLSAGPFFAHFERGFGLRGVSHSDLFRQGFGFGASRNEEADHAEASPDAGETDFMIPADADPERAQQLQEAIRSERRLHAELRAAGLL